MKNVNHKSNRIFMKNILPVILFCGKTMNVLLYKKLSKSSIFFYTKIIDSFYWNITFLYYTDFLNETVIFYQNEFVLLNEKLI